MPHDFDAAYWQAHWQQAGVDADARPIPASPALAAELAELAPGTALDAGCGEGAEAIELASRGWRVTGADISPAALQRARARADEVGADVAWLEADLGRWSPTQPFDLVTTFYAHPDMPQLDFYARIAEWVAAGGTLLIVGHLHGHGHQPVEASARAAEVVALLDAERWQVVTAEERPRELLDRSGRPVRLHDVIVRATRR